MPGSGMGFWGGLQGLFGGLGTLAGLAIDYPAQQRAAAERERMQRQAIAQTDTNAQQAVDNMGADAERFRANTHANTQTMYDSSMANNQRFYDNYFGADGAGQRTEEARRLTAPMAELAGKGSTLDIAREQAGQRLLGMDANLQGLRDSRGDLLQRQLALPTLAEQQQGLKDTADIAGQEAFRDQVYGDLMNTRGAAQIAGATSTATRQMADIDAQIKRLEAQGKTVASDPQLAALQAQKAQLGAGVADTTRQVQEANNQLWASTSTQLQNTITQSRDNLVNALNSSVGINSAAAAGLANAITGTYAEERNFVTQAFQDAVNTTMAQNQILSDVASTMMQAIDADANLRYEISVTVPNQLAGTSAAWRNQTESTYLAAMQTANQMADAWRQMGTNMTYNYSPETVELASYFDAAMGRMQQGFNNALAQGQYNLAGQQVRQQNETGWAGVAASAVNPSVRFGQNSSGQGSWSWGVGA